MHLPRFRIRTLKIVVTLVAALLSVERFIYRCAFDAVRSGPGDTPDFPQVAP